MPAQIVGTKNAEHYKWGGPQETACDAWYLVNKPEFTVIEELMPPGTSEVRHFHEHSRQFAFVLEGEFTIEIEHHEFVLQPGEGIEISPRQEHKAMNRSGKPVRFVMTSQPPSHGDKILV